MRDSDEPIPQSLAGQMTRRRFVVAGGALVSALSIEASALAALKKLRPPKHHGLRGMLDFDSLGGSDSTFLLVRREDFVRVQLDLFNVAVRHNSLVISNPAKPAFLVYTFGPQHVAEQALLEDDATAQSNSTTGTQPPGPGGVSARLSGNSRLAFQVSPADLPQLSLDSLLALPWTPTSAPLSTPQSGFTIGYYNEPSPTQTAIEIPWHVVLTPDSGVFATPNGLRLANGRGELWTARMKHQVGNELIEGASVRVPWTYDITSESFFSGTIDTVGPNASQPPAALPGGADTTNAQFNVEQSLTMFDRWNIARATNDSTLGNARRAVGTNRLWLSSRGGHLDAIGSWQIPSSSPASSLRQWKHRATAGRDQYVKVVDNGYLFPFGHRATVTIVSERAFQRASNQQGPTVARLRQYAYITILEPVVGYSGERDFPFTQLRIVTDRTPAIQAQQLAPSSNSKPPAGVKNPPQTSYTDGWVPYLNGAPYLFQMIGTDWAGREISFATAALFVLEYPADHGATPYINAYNNLASTDSRRVADLGGQKIAFAPPSNAGKPGDTDLHTVSLAFAARAAPGAQPAVLPTLAPVTPGNHPQAIVTLAVAEQLSGGAALPGNSSPAFNYHPLYASDGFGGGNHGRVFLRNAGTPAGLNFTGGSSGGLVTPNIQIDGISRTLGPVGAADAIATGTFDPSKWFANAAFLGGIHLAEIILTDVIDAGSADSPPPSIPRVQTIPSSDPTQLTTQVTWQPKINTSSGWISSANGNDVTMNLVATVVTNTSSPGTPNVTVSGEVDQFVFNLINPSAGEEFIALTFTSLKFTSGTGQKTHMVPQLANVTFEGPLSFVNALEEALSFTGDGNGLSVTVDPTGVHADVTASLPTIGMGLFSISGIAFSAALDLPLDGISPAVFTFGLASQADPFTISGGIFGGGGYFVMAIGTKDVQMIQVSFDFGAMIVLNLGIASGSASLTAGITYTYSTSPDESCELQAWIIFKGSLEILGIITLSLEFDLTLTYQEGASGKQLTGTATVMVGIGLFGFTKTVSLTAQKTLDQSGNGTTGNNRAAFLSSSNGAPTFAEQMDSTSWGTYCGAFA